MVAACPKSDMFHCVYACIYHICVSMSLCACLDLRRYRRDIFAGHGVIEVESCLKAEESSLRDGPVTHMHPPASYGERRDEVK